MRLPDLEAARADWTRLAEGGGNVFGTWDWADAWHRHLGAGAGLALGVARDSAGEARVILPLWMARRHPLRLLRFIGVGPGDEFGPVCAPADRSAAFTALRRHVEETLDGSGMFLGEHVHGDQKVARHLGATLVRRLASPVLMTGGHSWEDWLSSRSRNFRGQVRRRERALDRGYNVTYRLTRESGELDGDMRTLMRLHNARWNPDQSSVFRGPSASFQLDFARRALRNGWLRLWTLELDGDPVAVWYGLRFGGVDHFYQSGRDPAFERHSVGFCLLCHSIRCSFQDGMRVYRFGRGDETYKDRFAGLDPGLDTIAIPAGLRGRLALTGMTAALRMPPEVRLLARKLGGG